MIQELPFLQCRKFLDWLWDNILIGDAIPDNQTVKKYFGIFALAYLSSNKDTYLYLSLS